MASFNDFLNALKDGLKQLVAQSLADYKDAAVQDGEAFLTKTRADLERWTGELAQGQVSKDDFEWLVRGKKDLGEMEALKQAGLTLVRLDQFRTSLINLVIGTASKLFL